MGGEEQDTQDADLVVTHWHKQLHGSEHASIIRSPRTRAAASGLSALRKHLAAIDEKSRYLCGAATSDHMTRGRLSKMMLAQVCGCACVGLPDDNHAQVGIIT